MKRIDETLLQEGMDEWESTCRERTSEIGGMIDVGIHFGAAADHLAGYSAVCDENAGIQGVYDCCSCLCSGRNIVFQAESC